METLTTFLWFDKEAGEAAKFYTSIFKGSKIKDRTILHNTPSGTVEIVSIELLGREFRLMSAGQFFKFNEAISFVVNCDTQEQIDYYWNKLSADPKAEQCGWLKDKYGVSWQIIPSALNKLMSDPDPKKSKSVMDAMLQMGKIDIAALKRAYDQA